MQQPILLDTTLRDGEQSPGVYFTLDEKVHLAMELDHLGVSVIEAGIPGMGREEQEMFRCLEKMNLQAELLAWNRLNRDDVCASLQANVSHVHLSVPTSPQLLSKKICKDASWIFAQMDDVIDFAQREGLVVSLGAEDASRTDIAFLVQVFQHAQDLGVVRVRYADTLGILTPGKTAEVIQAVSQKLRIPIDFHGHNDFGMATANAWAAWNAGAQVISCSLLGIGERAGNTALEEFVGVAHFLEKFFPNFNFHSLRNTCSSLACMCNRPFPPHKPLFGSDIYRHESGIHVDGLLKSSENYEFFPPEEVGGERTLVVGKHSGRAAVKHLALAQGVELNDAQAQHFIDELRTQMSFRSGVDAERQFKIFLQEIQILSEVQ
ncbi:MAG TPA: hypothetical protein VLM37_01530 [Fibrobacteraceae bacterium]|nr:hypothetical protein [Fibrobacteraceae bacterium]